MLKKNQAIYIYEISSSQNKHIFVGAKRVC